MAYASARVPTMEICRIWFTTALGSQDLLYEPGRNTDEVAGYMA